MDWMRLNCRSTKDSPCLGINWGLCFRFGIWGHWLHRNSVFFGKERTQVDIEKEVMAKAIEFAFLGAFGKCGGHRTTIKINWHHPPENWVKLNTNGSSIRNPNLARGGGLICNANGELGERFC